MSIATRLEAINQHLLDDYSVLTLAGADLTNVNKNILNLKTTWQERLLYFINNGTDVVWNNWEKVTGEGTALTLNNTEEAPMTIALKGNTSQEGTPTPDSPVDINVVSGDNSIEVCGKNIFDKNMTTTPGYISDAGVVGGSAGTYHTTDFIPIVPNTSYVYSGATNIGGSPSRCYYDINKNFISGIRHDVQNPFINTSPANAYYMRESIDIANIGNLQIEVGTTATTYEPYTGASYPISLGDIELCKIGTYQDKIDKSSGKNLFDGELELGSYNGNTGEKVSTNDTYRNKNIIAIQPNTTYTFSINEVSQKYCLYYYDKNKTFISADTSLSTGTFTSLSNAYYINFRCFGGDYTANYPNLKVMLNEGSTALPYEPYGTSWYVKKEIGKVVLDGSETWAYYQNHLILGKSASSINMIPSTNQALCNYYAYTSQGQDKMFTTGNSFSIQVFDSSYTDNTTFKNWLSTHNMTVYYALNTPTYTEITDSTLLSQLEAVKRSYEGQTNISQTNDDLPFELDITALREMS